MNGKGDKQRPRNISLDEYEQNWDRIFRKKTTEEQDEKTEQAKQVRDTSR